MVDGEMMERYVDEKAESHARVGSTNRQQMFWLKEHEWTNGVKLLQTLDHRNECGALGRVNIMITMIKEANVINTWKKIIK